MAISSRAAQKTILLTGGSDGLGRAGAKEYLAHGWRVVITGRTREKLEKVIAELKRETEKATISYIVMDLSSIISIRAAAAEFLALHLPLDVLFLNAASMSSRRSVDKSGKWESTLFCAFVGHVCLADLLQEKVRSTPGSRVLITSSDLHNPANKYSGKPHIDFDNLDGKKKWDSTHFYSNAKLANILHARAIAREWGGVPVYTLEPGFVPTTSLSREHNWFVRWILRSVLTKMVQATSVEQAGSDYYYYGTSEEVLKHPPAQYLKHRKAEDISEEAHNDAKGKRLMDLARETIANADF